LPSPIDKASRREHRAGATAQPVMKYIVVKNYLALLKTERWSDNCEINKKKSEITRCIGRPTAGPKRTLAASVLPLVGH